MRVTKSASVRTLAIVLAGCAASAGFAATGAKASQAAAAKPLPSVTEAALKTKSVDESAPVYIRVFKEESELEIWKARANGRYIHVQTFPICNWSGTLGPKQALGDHMAPEGFYSLDRDSMKPDSKYHLALNVGYPNALDGALGRTGDFIMVHGNCVSVGCFAMTDALIEEVYAYVRLSLSGGQEQIPLHIFPFRMTAENLMRHAGHQAVGSWAPLKEAYDDFAKSKEPPSIGMCEKRYVVNPLVEIDGGPEADCPEQIGKKIAPVSPRVAKKLKAAGEPLVADGPKTRTPGDIANWSDAAVKAEMAAISSREQSRRERKTQDDKRAADMGGVTPFLAQ